MPVDSETLTERILDFMTVVHACWTDTNFANDRSVYARDLATAMGWIAALRAGADAAEVTKTIRSPETGKHFTDYWRQGAWGEREIEALKRLQEGL